MPRLSEPGPLGMRAEHWYDFGSLAEDSDLFVQVVADMAAVAVPNSVLQYLKAGQVTPLAKPTGGHRPLPTPKSVPTAGWIRVVLCQCVDFQLLLTQYFVQSWRSFAHITTQALNSSPIWTMGICGSNHSIYYRPLLPSLQPQDQSTLLYSAPKTHVWKGSCQDPHPT